MTLSFAARMFQHNEATSLRKTIPADDTETRNCTYSFRRERFASDHGGTQSVPTPQRELRVLAWLTTDH